MQEDNNSNHIHMYTNIFVSVTISSFLDFVHQRSPSKPLETATAVFTDKLDALSDVLLSVNITEDRTVSSKVQ